MGADRVSNSALEARMENFLGRHTSRGKGEPLGILSNLMGLILVGPNLVKAGQRAEWGVLLLRLETFRYSYVPNTRSKFYTKLFLYDL